MEFGRPLVRLAGGFKNSNLFPSYAFSGFLLVKRDVLFLIYI